MRLHRPLFVSRRFQSLSPAQPGEEFERNLDFAPATATSVAAQGYEHHLAAAVGLNEESPGTVTALSLRSVPA